MANDNEIAARGGLLPVQFPYGNYRKTLYRLTTDGATTSEGIFIGQPMALVASGYASPATIGDSNPVLGPVLGFVDTNKAGLPTNLTSLNQAAYLDPNNDAYVVIADDPDQYFQIQEDTGGTALTNAAVGSTFDYVYDTASGSTVTGYSTAQLDRSSVAQDSGGCFQLIGLVDRMNSDGSANDFGNYAKLLVRIQNHSLRRAQGTTEAI